MLFSALRGGLISCSLDSNQCCNLTISFHSSLQKDISNCGLKNPATEVPLS